MNQIPNICFDTDHTNFSLKYLKFIVKIHVKILNGTFYIENEHSNNEITILICLQSTEYRIFGYPLSALENILII